MEIREILLRRKFKEVRILVSLCSILLLVCIIGTSAGAKGRVKEFNIKEQTSNEIEKTRAEESKRYKEVYSSDYSFYTIIDTKEEYINNVEHLEANCRTVSLNTVGTINGVINGNLATTDCIANTGQYLDKYLIKGTEGDELTIEFSSGAFNTLLFLISLNFTEQTAIVDDNGGGGTNSRIGIKLPKSGQYLIVASSVSTSEKGQYKLKIKSVSGSKSNNKKKFDLSISPNSQTIFAGQEANLVMEVKQSGANVLEMPVNCNLEISPVDNNITAVLSTNMVEIGKFSKIAVKTTTDLLPGTYAIKILGQQAGTVECTFATIEVVEPSITDFNLEVEKKDLELSPTEESEITIKIKSIGGFSGKVIVTAPKSKLLDFETTKQTTTEESLKFKCKVKKEASGTQEILFSGKDVTGRVRTTTLTLTIK